MVSTVVRHYPLSHWAHDLCPGCGRGNRREWPSSTGQSTRCFWSCSAILAIARFYVLGNSYWVVCGWPNAEYTPWVCVWERVHWSLWVMATVGEHKMPILSAFNCIRTSLNTCRIQFWSTHCRYMRWCVASDSVSACVVGWYGRDIYAGGLWMDDTPSPRLLHWNFDENTACVGLGLLVWLLEFRVEVAVYVVRKCMQTTPCLWSLQIYTL